MNPKSLLENCDTLMLDMDGTVLDLAFDNYVWLELMPRKYAEHTGVSHDEAKQFLYNLARSVQGKLDWYCIDHWCQKTGLDILAIHRDVNERIAYLPGAQYKSAKLKMNPISLLENCDTLMLDMDGTVLDLAFDNYVWLELMPQKYAEHSGISRDEAKRFLYNLARSVQGKLDWYCIDHWCEKTGLDILAIHRDVNERIAYLPGAQRFLEAVSKRNIRLLLVTNSHRGTLALKTEVTGVADYFDEIYTSHDLGCAKEDQPFWQSVQDAESFDPSRTLFIDDNVTVLRSAHQFGVERLLTVTRPDTSAPLRGKSEFPGVEGVVDLLN